MQSDKTTKGLSGGGKILPAEGNGNTSDEGNSNAGATAREGDESKVIHIGSPAHPIDASAYEGLYDQTAYPPLVTPETTTHFDAKGRPIAIDYHDGRGEVRYAYYDGPASSPPQATS